MIASTNGGGPRLGLIVKMPAAATVELAGHAGFDLVLVDTEHGSGDMSELEHHVRAADSAGIDVLVRVSGVRSPDILRSLDAGAAGIVVPHLLSPADVRHAAALTHYPPEGRRSLALSTRAGRHGTSCLEEHLHAARRQVKLIGQLEDGEALEHIPEILAVDGLGGIFIGPADLSASLGFPGQVEHPTVAEAIDRIADAVLARPELVLCAVVADEQEASAWTSRGAGIVLFNAPSLMAGRLRTIVEALRTSADLAPEGVGPQ